MTAYVDNKKIKPLNVNYMMTGVPVSKDSKEIIIKYRPKYWYTVTAISIIFIIGSLTWFMRKRYKNK